MGLPGFKGEVRKEVSTSCDVHSSPGHAYFVERSIILDPLLHAVTHGRVHREADGLGDDSTIQRCVKVDLGRDELCALTSARKALGLRFEQDLEVKVTMLSMLTEATFAETHTKTHLLVLHHFSKMDAGRRVWR